MPEQCVLTGTIYDLRGLVAASGTKLYVLKVENVDFAHSTVRQDFVVGTDGTLQTLAGQPASLPQGAYVTLQGDVQGFKTNTRVAIPNLAEYDFHLLVPAASPPSTAVSQVAFNTLYDLLTNLTGVLIFIALANFALAGNSGLAGAIL